jgi:hypothetical protein
MTAATPYPYVYINEDGTARELHADERRYLETEFKGGDGAAPHIKESYDDRNGWGDPSGYMERPLLPTGMAILAAPAENPNRSLNREEYITWLRGKGMEVVENSDGSFTIKGKPQPRGEA